MRSLGWFASSTKLYLAMEYFPEGDLYNYIRENKCLSEDIGRQIATQIVSGLSLMHSEGYSHRDIKPQVSKSRETLAQSYLGPSNLYNQNILIYQHPNGIPAGAWWVKLADFGISKCLGQDTSLTAVFMGTTAYMAPELFQFESFSTPSNDHRPADVWALGVTIFFALTNTLPFQELASTIKYANENGKCFPYGPLDTCQVSPRGQSFIQEVLNPQREARLTLEKAKSHAWLECLLPGPQHSGIDSR